MKYSILSPDFLHHFLCRSTWSIFLATTLVLAFPGGAFGEESPAIDSSTAVKQEMGKVFAAFLRLQKHLLHEEDFVAKENEKSIQESLATLEASFHSQPLDSATVRGDLGFANTLQQMRGMLKDARIRFDEGKKSYALWRLRTSTDYCISCHTRHDVEFDFQAGLKNISFGSEFEKAELLLATRQFEEAKKSFLAVAKTPGESFYRMDALRRWLIIETRIRPHPAQSLQELRRLKSQLSLSDTEGEGVQEWISSFERWSKEVPSDIPPLQHAEQLIRSGVSMFDPITGKQGAVELLRATALLHEHLEKPYAQDAWIPEERAKALYLLGLAYSELPFYFRTDLSQTFLESCVREYPGSLSAHKSYRLLRKLILLSFTGSGGTKVPHQVKLYLDELYELAYKGASDEVIVQEEQEDNSL